MRTLSAGILALLGAAFLIVTAAPGTARAGEADAAEATVIDGPTPLSDSGTPAPFVLPGPPVNPVPIRTVPWPIEMPAIEPGTAWPILGAFREQAVDVTPQEIVEMSVDPIVDVLPVVEIV